MHACTHMVHTHMHMCGRAQINMHTHLNTLTHTHTLCVQENIAFSVTDPDDIVQVFQSFPQPGYWPDHDENTCNGYIPWQSTLRRFVWVSATGTNSSLTWPPTVQR